MSVNSIAKTISSKFLPNKLYHRLRLYKLLYKMTKIPYSYLVSTGFIDSFISQSPRDKENNPLPWMNYSIIDFLSSRLNNQIRLFEFGSGYSTLFYAKYVSQVTSVEHEEMWFEKVKELTAKQANAKVLLIPLHKNYSSYIQGVEDKFEVIVVDGRERVDCALNAYQALAPNGVLILDDSNREDYIPIWDFYKENGYKEITFKGLKPTGFAEYHSTIFYKPNNCLNL